MFRPILSWATKLLAARRPTCSKGLRVLFMFAYIGPYSIPPSDNNTSRGPYQRPRCRAPGRSRAKLTLFFQSSQPVVQSFMGYLPNLLPQPHRAITWMRLEEHVINIHSFLPFSPSLGCSRQELATHHWSAKGEHRSWNQMAKHRQATLCP
jgi:hypothetical protein